MELTKFLVVFRHTVDSTMVGQVIEAKDAREARTIASMRAILSGVYDVLSVDPVVDQRGGTEEYYG
jgi:hypothetical protein